MSCLFSTREIATVIWFAVFLFYALSKATIRNSFAKVLKAACVAKLIVPFVILLFYAAVITFALSQLPLWKWRYLKDIVIWFLFVGVPLCYDAVNKQDEKQYLKSALLSNLKLTVVIEFIISEYTFSLCAELIILPIVTLLTIVDVYTAKKEAYKAVNSACATILAIAGFVFFALAIRMAILDFQNVGVNDALIKLAIPIILSILFIPTAYLFAVYAKYEILFLRMSFREPEQKTIVRTHRQKVFLACGLSYKRICDFHDNYMPQMYKSMPQCEFDALIKKMVENNMSA